jgi:hypothetical protein
MTQMTISEVARQVGLEPSAIRYYEQIGLVPAPDRISGQRRYDTTALYRLAVIQRASERWQALSVKKLAELDTLMKEIRTMRRLLRKMMDRCHCDTLDQCGRGIFRSGVVPVKTQRALRPRQ